LTLALAINDCIVTGVGEGSGSPRIFHNLKPSTSALFAMAVYLLLLFSFFFLCFSSALLSKFLLLTSDGVLVKCYCANKRVISRKGVPRSGALLEIAGNQMLKYFGNEGGNEL
jgi:hypothetical protein